MTKLQRQKVNKSRKHLKNVLFKASQADTIILMISHQKKKIQQHPTVLR